MDDGAVAWLARRADVRFEPDLVDRPDDLLAAIPGAHALIVRNRTQVRGALLTALAAARIPVVGRLGVGLDNIDTAGCRRHGIRVIPATGANAPTVAEYVMATMLLLLRGGAYGASERVLAGEWPRQTLIGREAMGRTLGLVGFGGIARQVAARARAFGMAIWATDPFVAADDPAWKDHGVARQDLDDLLAGSDVLSLHVPLTDASRGLLNAQRLGRMKRGAVLINTSRGGIVDEAALADALASGRLGGAAMDVYAAEPLTAGSPLAGAPNLIATPHIAGVSREGEVRIGRMVVEGVWAALQGDGPHRA